MPIIQITVHEGREQETVETCIRNIARTVRVARNSFNRYSGYC
jgi:hypothetical protein